MRPDTRLERERRRDDRLVEERERNLAAVREPDLANEAGGVPRIAEQIDHLHLFGHCLRVGVARRPEPLASFGAAGSIGRIQDQLDRQARYIPMRKVTATVEPVNPRVGKCGESSCGLSWKADPIPPAPADDDGFMVPLGVPRWGPAFAR